jgi:hypothetical protein
LVGGKNSYFDTYQCMENVGKGVGMDVECGVKFEFRARARAWFLPFFGLLLSGE